MSCDTQYYIEAGTDCTDVSVGGGFLLDICFGAPGETGPQGPQGEPIDAAGLISLLDDLRNVADFETKYVFESDEDAITAGRTGFYVAAKGHVSASKGTLIILF
jgi:hypothetical protein